MRGPGRDCSRHVAALVALAARCEPGPPRPDLLAHLERCPRCAAELQELALTVFALRRLGDVPAAASISPSAWPRLRDRIERSRASAAALAWHWRTTLAGLGAATLLVAALAAPMALHVPLGASGAEPAGYSPRELDRLSRRIEHAYLLDAQSGTLPATTVTTADSTTVASAAGVPRRYPDGITPVGKEVQTRPTGRPSIVD